MAVYWLSTIHIQSLLATPTTPAYTAYAVIQSYYVYYT